MVILRCLKCLYLNLFKSYDTKHQKHKNSKNTNLTKLVNSFKNIFKYFKHFYEYSNEKLRYRDLIYLILKLLASQICNMKWEFLKKSIGEPQNTTALGMIFYGTDVSSLKVKWFKIPVCVWLDKSSILMVFFLSQIINFFPVVLFF